MPGVGVSAGVWVVSGFGICVFGGVRVSAEGCWGLWDQGVRVQGAQFGCTCWIEGSRASQFRICWSVGMWGFRVAGERYLQASGSDRDSARVQPAEPKNPSLTPEGAQQHSKTLRLCTKTAGRQGFFVLKLLEVTLSPNP